jgi:circadian clock protein KaiB
VLSDIETGLEERRPSRGELTLEEKYRRRHAAQVMQLMGPRKVPSRWRNCRPPASIRPTLKWLLREEEPLSKYLLRLFVTGTSSRTGTAIANLRRICEQELGGQYDLEIIDVLEFPDVAEDEKILATPTLIKSLPLPLRRVIGDLSDKEKVLLGLEVRSVSTDNTDGVAP